MNLHTWSSHHHRACRLTLRPYYVSKVRSPTACRRDSEGTAVTGPFPWCDTFPTVNLGAGGRPSRSSSVRASILLRDCKFDRCCPTPPFHSSPGMLVCRETYLGNFSGRTQGSMDPSTDAEGTSKSPSNLSPKAPAADVVDGLRHLTKPSKAKVYDLFQVRPPYQPVSQRGARDLLPHEPSFARVQVRC